VSGRARHLPAAVVVLTLLAAAGVLAALGDLDVDRDFVAATGGDHLAIAHRPVTRAVITTPRVPLPVAVAIGAGSALTTIVASARLGGPGESSRRITPLYALLQSYRL
jgi:hypothetical protein